MLDLSNILGLRINEYINSSSNVAVIIKGFSSKAISFITPGSIDLEKLVQNKLQYFFKTMQERRVFSYEEFLLLKSFVLEQYDSIIVINNNIYIEQYPIELVCSDEIINGLLNHFTDNDDVNDDDIVLGDISAFASIFIGMRRYKGILYGTYCDEDVSLESKVSVVNLFDNSEKELSKGVSDNNYIDLIEEIDFTHFINTIEENSTKYICIDNYLGDKYRLNEHLRIAAEVYSEFAKIIIVTSPKIRSSIKYSEDYRRILKEYWGHNEFREIDVYDLDELNNGNKQIVSISQEQVISDLVDQTENCIHKVHSHHDIFVTAPTGAGKSIMFQIPAIYLAEKYNLLTIVISPLIGLMNDQVKNLEMQNYKYAETINSDISPIIKEDIIRKVSSGECHILYISPETLLSRSDVEQLIGSRTIGMIIIDEAHIVTTWGKQFRPDYWYLGDHIRKLRSNQINRSEQSFLLATFTATAIYRGVEDMYTETINSLHMFDPITYLGYIRRNDINIRIERTLFKKEERNEYELNKLEILENVIKRAMITNKKTLVYFPTVSLIQRSYDYFRSKRMVSQIAVYYGPLPKDDKAESYEQFYKKEKLIMFATKAFGMGIDINDIELIVHFAPTGNVCDYVQEIGRAARKQDLIGEAYYNYNKRDFKHINRLHGLSTIRSNQLVEVIRKINDLYQNNLNNGRRNDRTKRRNAMLLDAENFAYIFDNTARIDDNRNDRNNINKVKTALLIIQKDFESKFGFSPITVRPIPLFSQGYFMIEKVDQKKLLDMYPECCEEINSNKHICLLHLDRIWKSGYPEYSFPNFKYLLYSKDPELSFNTKIKFFPALSVSINYKNDFESIYKNIINGFKQIIDTYIVSERYVSINELADELSIITGFSNYKMQSVIAVIVTSMLSFSRNYYKGNSRIIIERVTNDSKSTYQFLVASNSFFKWLNNNYQDIKDNTVNGKLYLINDNRNNIKEASIVLGVLEAMGVLAFEMIGGANSQIYIYINQIQNLRNIINDPARYNNKILNSVSERHLISVKMLTYLFEGNFNSEEIWDLLENYFLGIIPDAVKNQCIAENPSIKFRD